MFLNSLRVTDIDPSCAYEPHQLLEGLQLTLSDMSHPYLDAGADLTVRIEAAHIVIPGTCLLHIKQLNLAKYITEKGFPRGNWDGEAYCLYL